MKLTRPSTIVLFLTVVPALPALAARNATNLPVYSELRARVVHTCSAHDGVTPSNLAAELVTKDGSVLPDSWVQLQLDKRSVTERHPNAALAGGRTIELPAGSVDGLQAAIGAAGAGGVVRVRRGAHTESGTVTISQPVSIIGEHGAVLTFDTAADPSDVVLDPALYIFRTDHVEIRGLELRPAADAGGVAILLEDSPSCLIDSNNIYDYQNAIFLQHADGTVVKDNRVVVTPLWQTGALSEADGILNVNGGRVVMQGNDVSGGVFGVFISGTSGTFTGNHLHENLYGAILCKVPAGSFLLPSGAAIGSEVSATDWTLTWNGATDNFAAGFLVIDGANKNTLRSNSGDGNAAYDIELVGASTRFGFCTPTSFRNTVIAGPYRDTVIKDCGRDNKVNGGVLVDTTVDPCDAPCP